MAYVGEKRYTRSYNTVISFIGELNSLIDALRQENEYQRGRLHTEREKRYDLLNENNRLISENYRLTAAVARLENQLELIRGEIILPPVDKKTLANNELEIIACKNALKEKGITQYKQFKQSLADVVDAIFNEQRIGEINIAVKIKNPDFRFFTEKEPELSLKVSELLAKDKRSLVDLAEQGREKRTKNADNYANDMHDTILDILARQPKPIKSLREAARVLNTEKVPTPLRGEWHAQTLKQLNKRWENLGLNGVEIGPT